VPAGRPPTGCGDPRGSAPTCRSSGQRLRHRKRTPLAICSRSLISVVCSFGYHGSWSGCGSKRRAIAQALPSPFAIARGFGPALPLNSGVVRLPAPLFTTFQLPPVAAEQRQCSLHNKRSCIPRISITGFRSVSPFAAPAVPLLSSWGRVPGGKRAAFAGSSQWTHRSTLKGS